MDRLVWIYRLQQQMALTQRESWALLIVGGLLLVGQVVQRVAEEATPIPDYTATDAAFAEALRQYNAQQETPQITPQIGRPAAEDSLPAPKASAASSSGRSILDLNTATAEDLEGLPRIGPKLAARIVAYRTAQGGFRSVDELVNVSGIGQKTMGGLTPLLHIAPTFFSADTLATEHGLANK